MFVKQELEGARVKGLCFHPNRSWLLASFISGEIVIYDYDAGVVVQKYTDHSVPVRSVHFHATKSLFCSGSDDNTVRVFDYQRKRCICIFNEHIDFVRSVQFHHKLPLIVSASDDQTVRIWNYETHQSVSILSGHNHYVMTAFFHPTSPLILSASLDGNICVWDVSDLFKHWGKNSIFALTDPILKFQQEGHVSGVNWAQWHPSKPLIVSCGVDKSIKIWKITDTNLYIIATLRSHMNNVSCVIFHPTLDIIISGSEDNTVRVWDSKRFLHLIKNKRSDDRFWVVSSHNRLPIFAAGHDSGLTVFRLLRKRPAFDVCGTDIIYYKDNAIRKYSISNQTDGIIGQTKPHSTGGRASPLDQPPRSFSYSSSQDCVLVGYQEMFEIHQLGEANGFRCESGYNPVWITRKHYAYFSEQKTSSGYYNQLCVCQFSDLSITKLSIPESKFIFSASTECVLLVGVDQVTLFDVMKQKILAQKYIPGTHYAYQSPDKKHIAFFGNNSVTITRMDLTRPLTYNDDSKIKSGCWGENFYVFSTRTHIKYLLPNGDNGIIRSISDLLYIITIVGHYIICFSSDSEIRKIKVNFIECELKNAMVCGNMSKVVTILKNVNLYSDNISDYFQKSSHPEIALPFVEDPISKFRIAVNSGELGIAEKVARIINDPSIWISLAEESMLRGDFQRAEMAYEKSGNKEKLSFFYLISGQSLKLNEMDVDDPLALQRCVWTNNHKGIALLLKDSAPSLAYLAAKSDNKQEIMESLNIHQEVSESFNKLSNRDLKDYSISTGSDENWPLLNISKPCFSFDKSDDDMPEDNEESKWDINIPDEDDGGGKEEDNEDDGWDLKIEEIEAHQGTTTHSQNIYIPPYQGKPMEQKWISTSQRGDSTNVPGELAAAGEFGQALQTLQEQIALYNPDPLRDHFVECYVSAHSVTPALPSTPFLNVPLSYHDQFLAPNVAFNVDSIMYHINNGYKATSKGSFTNALTHFRKAIHIIPLVVVDTKADSQEVLKLLDICKNYITGMLLEKERKQTSDIYRQFELAAYFAHCQLRKDHSKKTLQLAIAVAVKAKLAPYIIEFSQRLLNDYPELNNYEIIIQNAQKILNMGTQPQIDYDSRNPFDICCGSHVPIYRGSPKVTCPFCSACYQDRYAGSLCNICDLCKVGEPTKGLTIVRPHRKE